MKCGCLLQPLFLFFLLFLLWVILSVLSIITLFFFLKSLSFVYSSLQVTVLRPVFSLGLVCWTWMFWGCLHHRKDFSPSTMLIVLLSTESMLAILVLQNLEYMALGPSGSWNFHWIIICYLVGFTIYVTCIFFLLELSIPFLCSVYLGFSLWNVVGAYF